jgi:hypothetical protein
MIVQFTFSVIGRDIQLTFLLIGGYVELTFPLIGGEPAPGKGNMITLPTIIGTEENIC